jgi:hypothetical protein
MTLPAELSGAKHYDFTCRVTRCKTLRLYLQSYAVQNTTTLPAELRGAKLKEKQILCALTEQDAEENIWT